MHSVVVRKSSYSPITPIPRAPTRTRTSAATSPATHSGSDSSFRGRIESTPLISLPIHHPAFGLRKTRSSSLATAADLPVELFGHILDHIGADSCDDRHWSYGKPQFLQSCSLVCVYWTNRCRDRLFRHRDIRIRSSADLDILHYYDAHGSQRLVPLRALIKDIVLVHSLDEHVWYHYPFTSPLCRKPIPFWFEKARQRLVLRGSSLAAHSSQISHHWGSPVTLPGCCLTFTEVTLTDIHIHTLTNFLWPLREFKSIASLILRKITWKVDGDAPPGRRNPAGKLRHVEVQDCTNNTLICLRTWQVYDATFPWVQLPRAEQKLGFEEAHSPRRRDSTMISAYFICFTRCCSDIRRPSSLRFVSLLHD